MRRIFEKILTGEPLAGDERAQFLAWADKQQAEDDPEAATQTAASVVDVLTSKGMLTQVSDLSRNIGVMQSGEFRVGNDKAPGDGFTGGRFGYPGFTYGSIEYFLVGVENDVLQVGLALADGTIKAGGGDVTIDSEGIWITNQQAAFGFEDTAGVRGRLYIYSDAFDALVLKNSINGAEIRLDVDTTDDTTVGMYWVEDPANANVSLLTTEIGTGGGKFSIGGEVVIWAEKDGVETVFNEGSYDIDHRFEGATDANLLKLDGGLDAIGMGGAAQSGYKLKVTGDTSLDGALIVNDSGADKDTVIETNNQTQAFYMDGGLDKATSFAWDGWQACDETWTRTGDFTFTVSGDVTNKFRKGTKVRYTDSGVEYGVVASSSYSGITLLTTVTLITNTDYAMSGNSSDRFISYIENPERFPHWFNWNANPQGFSSPPTSTAYRFTTYGNTITLQYTEAGNGTSNATTFTASAPVAPQQACSAILSATVDNNVLQTTPGRVALTSGSTTMTLREDTANGAWTNASGKRAVFFITYEF